jgi:hypothetical protein
MPSDKLPRRMLSAWVYQAKGSSATKFDSKKTTYGGTVARYHFKYVLMYPSVHPEEVERRSIKTGKKITALQLKADKFYDRASIDACDKNWVHIAEHRSFQRECVVKTAKFHYNYRDPDEYKPDKRRRRIDFPLIESVRVSFLFNRIRLATQSRDDFPRRP